MAANMARDSVPFVTSQSRASSILHKITIKVYNSDLPAKLDSLA